MASSDQVNTSKSDLKKLSEDKIADAKVLLGGDRLDGARYLCGYAVELILKYQICDTLNWETFPPAITSKDPTQVRKSLKTHDLEVLLLLSGKSNEIFNDENLQSAWDEVSKWDSENRYSCDPVDENEVRQMIEYAIIITRYFGLEI